MIDIYLVIQQTDVFVIDVAALILSIFSLLLIIVYVYIFNFNFVFITGI